jgi:hypothetical protein
MDIFSASVDTLFISSSNQSEQLESLANQALSSGITKYQDGDYKGDGPGVGGEHHQLEYHTLPGIRRRHGL